MTPLVSLNQIQITMGSKLLFEDLSLGIFDNEKIGLIGPNGAGKSTLLKIISGLEKPDKGEVNVRRNLKISYLSQTSTFDDQKTVTQYIVDHLIQKHFMNETDAEVQAAIELSMAGFENTDQKISELSGGWRKRLAMATCLAEDPDLLILDEPTNHMDWDGIMWLERTLQSLKKPYVLVSHDRIFLNQLTTRTIEINPLYSEGYLSFNAPYFDFLLKKEEYVEAQMKLQKVLSNKAKREIDWLRAGVKARTTKSSARMKDAYELIDQLKDVKQRNFSGQMTTRLEIDATQRKSKKLIEIINLNIGFKDNDNDKDKNKEIDKNKDRYKDKVLIKDLNIVLGPKYGLGIIGQNGSGKTTFLKTLQNPELALSGTLKTAEDLKIVYFDQKRETLPLEKNLMQFLGDDSDQVVFKDKSMHVASYASRFLFTAEKMHLKIAHLSGGEQARLLIAKLFLQPADVLILDEPTNDLDIDTIEVIEQTLSEFEGLLLVVSHDRKFLKELCHNYLVFEGDGNWANYANLDQWLKDNKKTLGFGKAESVSKSLPIDVPVVKKTSAKLSYKDKLALETIEEDIHKAEEALLLASQELENLNNSKSSNNSNLKDQLNLKIEALTKAQAEVDRLYALWNELESKK